MLARMPASGARHRVVVVGAGFGGLACARALDGSAADVLLIDRHNYHLFTPLLYQVATSLLNPSDIAYPLRAIFRRSRNVRFRQATVENIDFERRTVRITTGEEFGYDSLVIATGSTNNYFANASVAHHTLGMKTLTEATRLRNHVLSCLELAARATGDERRALLTFVVVGGGPTGVEYAGALSELLRMVLGKDYPEISPGEARIVLVEGIDRLLGAFHPKLGAYAADELRSRGIDVRTGTLVESAGDDHVQPRGGERIDTRTIVWSAGVRPTDPAGDDATIERSRSKRIAVDEHLGVPGRDGVYAIGDAASVSQNGEELPMLSPPAMQAGRHVARAIRDRIAGATKPHEPFRYVDKGTMATIGRRAAVADVRGLKLKGTLGWLAWLTVHIYFLIGFRNRAAVLASWGWDYIRRDRPIRLILRSDPDPLAEEVDPGT